MTTEQKYLVKTTEKVSYIVPQDFLESMIINLITPEDVVCMNQGHKIDWHIGNDQIIYEELELNQNGKMFHEQTVRPESLSRYFSALKELRKNDEPQHLKEEKQRLKTYLKVNEIADIIKYEGKEFEKATTPKASMPTF